ncbi:Hypothetical protein HDN1F_15520 [gamma proteobacterium HdN1]|nr:Hypothetical protein HDN1F_15520 [gamma proteobacterium HdN1]
MKTRTLKRSGSALSHTVQVGFADSFFTRLLGLLPRRELPFGQSLLITPCTDVHTWFMRFTIDIVFLDKQHKIVGIREHVRPFRFALGPRSTASVLELTAGAVEKLALKTDDHLSFDEASV